VRKKADNAYKRLQAADAACMEDCKPIEAAYKLGLVAVQIAANEKVTARKLDSSWSDVCQSSGFHQGSRGPSLLANGNQSRCLSQSNGGLSAYLMSVLNEKAFDEEKKHPLIIC
jgi:hypothetical protein